MYESQYENAMRFALRPEMQRTYVRTNARRSLVTTCKSGHLGRRATRQQTGFELEVEQMSAEHRLSPEAAYGKAHARMVTILEQNGCDAAHAIASEVLNDLTRDGWKRAPRDLPPPRPVHGAPPDESYREMRRRVAAENAARNAEIARREGRELAVSL